MGLSSRRRFLKAVLAAGAAAVTAGVVGPALREQPPPSSHISAVQEYGNSTTTAGPLTPISSWYVVQIGPTPSLQAQGYRLAVEGLVERELQLTLKDLLSMPAVELYDTIQCVSDSYFLRANVKWRGVPLKHVLDMAAVRPEASKLALYAADGYSTDLPLSKAYEPDTLLAYMADDEPLAASHGYPVRLVAPRWWGYKYIKWIVKIVVTNSNYLGYWESLGYPDAARKAP